MTTVRVFLQHKQTKKRQFTYLRKLLPPSDLHITDLQQDLNNLPYCISTAFSR